MAAFANTYSNVNNNLPQGSHYQSRHDQYLPQSHQYASRPSQAPSQGSFFLLLNLLARLIPMCLVSPPQTALRGQVDNLLAPGVTMGLAQAAAEQVHIPGPMKPVLPEMTMGW